jgi:hypothetical protein
MGRNKYVPFFLTTSFLLHAHALHSHHTSISNSIFDIPLILDLICDNLTKDNLLPCLQVSCDWHGLFKFQALHVRFADLKNYRTWVILDHAAESDPARRTSRWKKQMQRKTYCGARNPIPTTRMPGPRGHITIDALVATGGTGGVLQTNTVVVPLLI